MDSRLDKLLDELQQKRNLYLEIEQAMYNAHVAYVKIHAPDSVLLQNAAAFSIPIKCQQTVLLSLPKPFFKCMRTRLLDASESSTSFKQRAREALFQEPLAEFTSAERCSVVYSILKYSTCAPQMLLDGALLAMYPLHDGPWAWPEGGSGPLGDRQLLARYWASARMLNKQQPMDLLEKYFGVEVATYYMWMGFMNKMLMFASVLGILTTVYSFTSYSLFDIVPIREVCTSNKTICPRCKSCNYTLLQDYCGHYKLSYTHDNIATIIFAVAMSLWATICLELWQRTQAKLHVRWNTIHTNILEEDITRPQFLSEAKLWRKGKYTNEWEQVLPRRFLLKRYSLSTTIVTCMIILVLVVSFGVIVCELELARMAVSSQWLSFGSSMATLAIMTSLRRCYSRMATWLTDLEVPRTQFDYDRSYMVKVVAFSLVNNYGKLLYIAFLKGALFTYPGESDSVLASDTCDPPGCVTDVFMLLMVIVLVRPLYIQLLEFLLPVLSVWRKRILIKDHHLPRWEQDYNLQETGHFITFTEFDKMVRQYGFTILLVPAFPLAPLCALVYNLVDVRLDAIKLLKYCRRPNPRRVSGLGIWFDTMQAITYIAVVTHALYISFTSEFVPKLIYRLRHDWSLIGYVDYTLSEFGNASALWPALNIDTCYYVAFRNPPDSEKPYQNSFDYYYILSARLSLAMLIAVGMFGITGIVAYVIPNMPYEVKSRLAYDAKKARGLLD